MLRTRIAIAAVTAGALLVGAGPAVAQNLYQEYKTTGRINPCRYSPGQLNQQLKNLPPDLEQYAPGFADQLRGARGACGSPGGAQGSVSVPVPIPLSGPTPPSPTIQIAAPPAPKPTRRTTRKDVVPPVVTVHPVGTDVPGWLIALLVAGLGGALAVAAVARYGGDRFGAPLRASLAEAGTRTADALAYARDLVRYGR